MLSIENRPSAFRVLPCLGVCRVTRDRRCGFVYRPPSYIAHVDNKDRIQRGLSQPRLPQTLLERIEEATMTKKSVILPLGDRFHLARQLARSLYVMHTAGWVHKK